jgi:Zn-dependent protease with chaperone function
VEARPVRLRIGEARALERREGVEGTRFTVEDVDRFTTAPNAEATGLGPTRTVILWNTLLSDDFSRGEVRAVLGHEIAHIAHDDPLKRVGWLALFLIPAAGLIELFTRRRGGWPAPRRRQTGRHWKRPMNRRSPAQVPPPQHDEPELPDPPGWTSLL